MSTRYQLALVVVCVTRFTPEQRSSVLAFGLLAFARTALPGECGGIVSLPSSCPVLRMGAAASATGLLYQSNDRVCFVFHGIGVATKMGGVDARFFVRMVSSFMLTFDHSLLALLVFSVASSLWCSCVPCFPSLLPQWPRSRWCTLTQRTIAAPNSAYLSVHTRYTPSRVNARLGWGVGGRQQDPNRPRRISWAVRRCSQLYTALWPGRPPSSFSLFTFTCRV